MQQERTVGLLLSAVQPGDIDRQQLVSGSQQQWCHSAQCHVDSRVDEADHRPTELTIIN